MPSLTDIFNTEAMRGSWDVIMKLSIVGTIVSTILSVLGLFSMISVVLRNASTIAYLSNRQFWDTVDETKSDASAKFKSASGLDKVMVVFWFLVPNLKGYSDAASAQFNLTDDDTTMSYILKAAIPSIATIVFSAMCFNGLLFQIYANFSDALLAGAQQLRDIDMAKSVNAFFSEGKDYTITLDADGSMFGGVQGKVAKSIYVDSIQRAGSLSSETKAIVGGRIETVIGGADFKKHFNDIASGMSGMQDYIKTKNETAGENTYAKYVKIKVTPGNRAGKTTMERIQGTTSIFIPATQVTGFNTVEKGINGYIVTLTPNIPSRSTFTIDQKNQSGTTPKTTFLYLEPYKKVA